MKVLQISTPFLPITSELGYGGTERIVYLLERGLFNRGFSSGVVAPNDSKPEGRLLPTIKHSMGVSGILDNLQERNPEEVYLRLDHLAKSIKHANNSEADLVHIHDDNLFAFGDLINPPSILTLHTFYELFWDTSLHPFTDSIKTKLVAISNSQKKIYESHGYKIDFVVHHGIDEKRFSLSNEKYPYLLNLGCIHPLKRQEDVIEIGKRTDLDVIIAGNIGSTEYFKERILPFIDVDISKESDKFKAYIELPPSPKNRVIYTGTVNDQQKVSLYSNALAFLMPLGLEEPFGLVMIESMMSGTPVIAYNRGSVSEIVLHEKTGFIVNCLEEMVEAVKEVGSIRPSDCRNHSIINFSSRRMVDDYLKIYQQIAKIR